MIPGTGTIVNAAAIIAGGSVGLLLKSRLKKELCDPLIQALGVGTMFIGASGALVGLLRTTENGLETRGTMLLILSLIIGTFIGSLLGICAATERLGEYLKRKVGATGDARFTDSFVSASFTVCIGAMAIVGSIEDGLNGNPNTLFIKALLDAVFIMIFASVTGLGAVFSALPVAVFQGSVTIIALLAAGAIPDAVIANMSFVGSVLVFCVGVNLMFHKDIRVADMLPAVFVAIPLTYLL